MKKYMVKMLVVCVITLLCGSGLFAQSLLENDTLYIGNVTGSAGQQVMVPVYIKTTASYQGWQIPINFGFGQSPVYCDSVSTSGTVMETWAFQAPFTNNNEWDNVQTCGIAGLVNFMGGSIPAGYYQVMKMFFTIDGGASAQTIPLDTTTSRWYDGGPPNSYIVTVGGVSYITHVVQGYIEIEAQGLEENRLVKSNVDFTVYPTIARQGDNMIFSCAAHGYQHGSYRVYDVAGRSIACIPLSKNRVCYSTKDLTPGVYYVTLDIDEQRVTEKIIIE